MLESQAKEQQKQEQNKRELMDMLNKDAERNQAESKKRMIDWQKQMDKDRQKLLDSQPKLEIPNTTDEERY